MTYADRLRAARERAGMSQRTLGAGIGVSGTAISNWECGEREPSEAHAAALKIHLGVEPPQREPESPHATQEEALEAATQAILAHHNHEVGAWDGESADEVLTAFLGGTKGLPYSDKRLYRLLRRAMKRAVRRDPTVGKYSGLDHGRSGDYQRARSA